MASARMIKENLKIFEGYIRSISVVGERVNLLRDPQGNLCAVRGYDCGPK